MKDTFDIVTDIRGLINVPSVTSLLGSGKVWPLERPTASTNIDIVVRSNGGTNDADQVCFAEINIHVPNTLSTINGKPQSLANQIALSNLVKVIVPLIDEQYKSTFRCWLEEIPVPDKDNDGHWFVNITVRYQSLQDNYTNI